MVNRNSASDHSSSRAVHASLGANLWNLIWKIDSAPNRRLKGPARFASGLSRSGHGDRNRERPRQSAAAQGKVGGGSRRLRTILFFGDVANTTSHAVGRALAFVIAAGVVLAWAVTGPLFQYSDTGQLVINTGTSVVTFLMVFLIQNSQNRDSAPFRSSSMSSFASAPHIIPLSESNTSRTMNSKITCGSRKGRRGFGEADRPEGQRGCRSRGGVNLATARVLNLRFSEVSETKCRIYRTLRSLP